MISNLKIRISSVLSDKYIILGELNIDLQLFMLYFKTNNNMKGHWILNYQPSKMNFTLINLISSCKFCISTDLSE